MRLRGDGSTYKRGSRWWLKYSVNGTPVRESAGGEPCECNLSRSCKHRRHAERVLRERTAQGRTGSTELPRHRRIKVGEILGQYLDHLRRQGRKSIATAETCVRNLADLHPVRAADLEAAAIDRWVTDRLARGNPVHKGELSNGTVNRDLNVLRSALFYALKKRRTITTMPYIEMLPTPPPRTDSLDSDTFQRFVAALPDWLQPVAHFCRVSSRRRGEVARGLGG